MKNSMSDDKEWRRKGKELSKNQTKEAIIEAQICGETEDCKNELWKLG